MALRLACPSLFAKLINSHKLKTLINYLRPPLTNAKPPTQPTHQTISDLYTLVPQVVHISKHILLGYHPRRTYVDELGNITPTKCHVCCTVSFFPILEESYPAVFVICVIFFADKPWSTCNRPVQNKKGKNRVFPTETPDHG